MGGQVILWKLELICIVTMHLADLMDGLRETPGREALKLRSEVSLTPFYHSKILLSFLKAFYSSLGMLLLKWI